MRRSFLRPLLALAAVSCIQPPILVKDDSPVVLSQLSLQAPNPSLPGPYTVEHMYYGSGTDKQRVEYRDSVAIKTPTLDAKDFVTFRPAEKKERKKFFGFDVDKFPLNARVWYPAGDGPFPLLVIMHGNHDYRDFSDPGYRYLGELLASRGFIVASLDENFLNSSSAGNASRAWFMLKHLELWKKWNETPGNMFYHKVDWNNLAIAGHSRGGEAVGHVALFNTLDNYPENANVKFNFHYPIKSVIAIAPVDEQYTPGDKLTMIKNVNYFVLHGSHDGDVSTFQGLSQYQRVVFTDDKPWFKAALYIYRANHGQFNTVWGPNDRGPSSWYTLDRDRFISGEDQRLVAKLYISAFLEATLHGKREYLPMFEDHRTIGQWLPKTIYMTRFQANDFRTIADFEEDIDVRTASIPGSRIDAESLSVWKEATLPSRTFGNRRDAAVYLGWNNYLPKRGEVTDTIGRRTPARYTIRLPDSLSRAWRLGPDCELALSVGNTGTLPGPRPGPEPARRDSARRDSTKTASPAARKKNEKPWVKKDTVPPDFSVEVETSDGLTSRVALSAYGPIRPPLKVNLMRFKNQERPEKAELMLQDFRIPLADFVKATPELDLSRIVAVRLVFDRVAQGEVAVDDIGFVTPGRPLMAPAPRPTMAK